MCRFGEGGEVKWDKNCHKIIVKRSVMNDKN